MATTEYETVADIIAERDALRKDGPPMQRGTYANGNPWMGTMRQCLEDYKLAAHAEAEGRRYMEREFEALRKDAERYRKLRDGQNWPAAFARHDAPEPLRGVDLDAACDGAA